MRSHLNNFTSVSYCFSVLSEKTLCGPNSWNVFVLFSFSHLVVLNPIFKYLVYLNLLCIWWDIGIQLPSLVCGYSVSQHWIYYLFSNVWSQCLYLSYFDMIVCIYSWKTFSYALVFVCFYASKYHAILGLKILWYVLEWHVMESTALHTLLRIVLVAWDISWLHIVFRLLSAFLWRISLLLWYKGYWMYRSHCEVWTFYRWILTCQEHGNSFLFWVLVNFFHQSFIVFIIQVLLFH
jgi:hypothetical protein